MAVSPWSWDAQFTLESDSRKPFVLEGVAAIEESPQDGSTWMGQVSLNWKPRPNINLSIGPQYAVSEAKNQWVGRFADPLMTETYRPPLCLRPPGPDRRLGRDPAELDAQPAPVAAGLPAAVHRRRPLRPLRGGLAQAPRFAFNLYGENGSTVEDISSTTVDPDGDGPALTAFAIGNPDFNMKSLRGTIVFRWEYRPGSLFYLV